MIVAQLRGTKFVMNKDRGGRFLWPINSGKAFDAVRDVAYWLGFGDDTYRYVKTLAREGRKIFDRVKRKK